MIKFTLDATSPEAIDALTELSLQKPAAVKQRRIIRTVFIAAAVIYLLLFIISFFKYRTLTTIYLIGIIVFLVLAFFIKPYQKAVLRKGIKNNTPDVTTEYTADEAGIHIHSSLGDSDIQWSAIITIGDIGNFFFLEMKTHQFILCNKTQVSAEELESLQKLSEAKTSKN